MKFAEIFILILALIGSSLHAVPADAAPAPEAAPPNILIILTDDQGLSDLSFYGNPSLETPQLDALARDSVRLEDFLAAPTCSPTRAALMTGQHEFKVGITHTISGRSVLKPGVPTLAEHFQSAGYRTGIFGKWHLGETYPSRPQDRGFEEVFIHLGGGIGQTPDYWGNSYFDPHIQHMGQWTPPGGTARSCFFNTHGIGFSRPTHAPGLPIWHSMPPTPRCKSMRCWHRNTPTRACLNPKPASMP